MKGKAHRTRSFLQIIKPTRLDGLALLLGAFFGFAWPQTQISGLAWLAPASLMALIWMIGWRSYFRPDYKRVTLITDATKAGFFWGFGLFLIVLSWLRFIPFPLGALLGWISLSAYLAIFIGIWSGWMALSMPGVSISTEISNPGHLGSTLQKTAEASNSNRLPIWSALAGLSWTVKFRWALQGAVCWTLLEWCYGHFLTGFPWTFIATTQYQLTPLIQIASFTGIYGVSFIIVWMSLSLFLSMASILGTPGQLGWRWAPDLAPAGLAVIFVFVWGQNRIGEISKNWNHSEDSGLRIAAVQPAIPQSLIWDPNETSTRFDRLMELSREAVDQSINLIIWPESALLGMELEMYEQISDFAFEHSIWMVMGVEDAEIRSGSITDPDIEWDVYNAAALIDPEGRFKSIYRKRHLVIFGEYIPLSHWIPFLKYLTPIEGGFQRGQEATPFVVESEESNGKSWKIQPLICFEDVLPGLTRKSLDEDTDFILNLTNDGWFGKASAHWQHWANATFRAVENGIPLLQCGNNGVTLWVDPIGVTHGMEFAGEVPALTQYDEGWKIWTIPNYSSTNKSTTPYRQSGDTLIAWMAFFMVIFGLIGIASTYRRVEQKAYPVNQ